MTRFLLYPSLLLILLTACKREKVNIISYDLQRTDFIEKISARGTIQAVNTLTIVTPRIMFSNVTVQYLAEDGAYVKKGETICILDAPELISFLESGENNLEITKADMNKLEADNIMKLSVLQAQIEINESKVAQYSLDSIQQKYAPPVKQKLFALELEMANVEKTKLRKKFAAQKRIDDAELRSMKSRIMRVENDNQRFKDQIISLTIVAPRDGIVMHVESPVAMFLTVSGSGLSAGTRGGKIKINSSVFPSMPLLKMPELNQMQLSVEVPEVDYKRIELGQKVFISVDAIKDLGTTGKIKKKTLVGKQAEGQPSVKIYEVIVSVDSCHLQMKPGLSALCNIIVDEVKDTVVVPTLAIFEKDSTKIIYVSNGEKFSAVTVETGLANSSESIISKGLTGDETIALVEPPFKMVVQKEKVNREVKNGLDSIRKDTIIKRLSKKY